MNQQAKRWCPPSGIRRWTAECADSELQNDLGCLAHEEGLTILVLPLLNKYVKYNFPFAITTVHMD